MRHRIVLVGFGNVGREFARLLLEHRSELTREFGLDASIVAILTARHGSVENPRGIDVRGALRLADAGVSLESCGRGISERSPEYIRRAQADTVIEVTPLRIAPRQVALDHLIAALRSGKHVITANKGPVVYHYRQLRDLARQNDLGFRYEGTVMDGAPVFNLFQEALRVARGDRSGPSVVLGQRHLEFARRADEHAEGVPDRRARSGSAPDRVRGVRRSDCDSRRPSVSVSLGEHAYIARTGWAADAGRPRRDVRHPAPGPRGAVACRVRGPARAGADRRRDGPLRPRVAPAREPVCSAGAEPETLPRRSEVASREDRTD